MATSFLAQLYSSFVKDSDPSTAAKLFNYAEYQVSPSLFAADLVYGTSPGILFCIARGNKHWQVMAAHVNLVFEALDTAAQAQALSTKIGFLQCLAFYACNVNAEQCTALQRWFCCGRLATSWEPLGTPG